MATSDLFYNTGTLDASQQAAMADLMNEFDNQRAVQERTMSRFGLPALSNYEKDWSIARTQAGINQQNKFRMTKNTTGTSSTAGSSGGGGRGGGGDGSAGRQTNPYAVKPTTTSVNPQSKLARAMAILPFLFGEKGFADLQRQGLIKFVKDAYGNVLPVMANNTNQATEISRNPWETAYNLNNNQDQLGYEGMIDDGSQYSNDTFDSSEYVNYPDITQDNNYDEDIFGPLTWD